MITAAALAAGAGGAYAQLPADARWSTIESRNFRITYEQSLDEIARHAAASAERAHAALKYMVARAPTGTIDIVLTDNLDFSNGYATPFPNNRVVIYAKPPVDVIELQYTRDWIELVITHELAHVFHLDMSGGVGRIVRAIFGRVPWPWPVFPVVATPLWSTEGLAVGVESNAAGFGRLHGSYHEMVVRTAALEDEIDDIHRLSSSSPVWPGGSRVYIYGSLFMDYLNRRYGPDATGRLVRTTAGAIIPPPLWYNLVASNALGVSFQDAYADWKRELAARYSTLSARLRAEGLTQSQRLTTHGRIALHARYSPDSRLIAYASNDGRTAPRTNVIDAASTELVWTRQRNDIASVSWLADSALITSDLQYRDRFRIYSDLYRVERDERSRLTRGARLQEPDATRDGRRVVAVENGMGTNRLVLVDPSGESARVVTPFDAEIHWAQPRWAPDGRRFAVGRWQSGGGYDVVVMDTLGTVLLQVTDGVGVNTGPAWSPDGRWLLFASDRTGISNIYGADMVQLGDDSGTAPTAPPQPRLRQVTNVLTGAYYPDISPDGRWIVFSAYHHDGFSIERMPFMPETWREPQRESITQLVESREAYDTQIRPQEFAASVQAAVERTDTIAGPTHGYRPLRHMRPYFWLPILEERAGDDYFGMLSFGADLVDRHDWDAEIAVAPESGRTVGTVSYQYRGLPTVPALGAHPTFSVLLHRDWDDILRVDSTGFAIDEREDLAALGVGLTWLRWRRSMVVSLSGEIVRRSRDVFRKPTGVFVDPEDDLIGVRASTSYATYVMPAFAISRENGFVLQLSARERRERSPTTIQTSSGPRTFDGSYTEWTTWDAAYLALPLGGFSRHVVGVRFSALYRSGPGASTASIGGASGGGVGIPGVLDDIGGAGRFLPLRGFSSGVRRGTRAWTASADYRFPLALITRSLAPLPIYFDRLAGSLFADAGHAWCGPTVRFTCASTSAADPPLLSAGAELTGYFSIWGAPVPLRLGIGIPIQGGNNARIHLVTGLAF